LVSEEEEDCTPRLPTKFGPEVKIFFFFRDKIPIANLNEIGCTALTCTFWQEQQ
jgi:hypothetical protein